MPKPIQDPPTQILTIGHSTRLIDEFIAILKAHGVQLLADIRTVPRSRRNPQYSKESLPGSLAAVGIGYEHFAGLGGLRKPKKDSPNTGWRNEGFRGYADYMQTQEFETGVVDLIQKARAQRVAVMCAEAVPWRCHRSLLADALTIRGIHVEHIMTEKSAKDHTLTPWAKVEDASIMYPPETLPLNLESGDESPR